MVMQIMSDPLRLETHTMEYCYQGQPENFPTRTPSYQGQPGYGYYYIGADVSVGAKEPQRVILPTSAIWFYFISFKIYPTLISMNSSPRFTFPYNIIIHFRFIKFIHIRHSPKGYSLEPQQNMVLSYVYLLDYLAWWM